MGTTLPVLDAAITDVARLIRSGKSLAALNAVDAVLTWPTLEDDDRLRLLNEAAGLAIRMDRFRRSRAYIRQAIALAPGDAAGYYELGRSFEDDPNGCDAKARRCFRKAVTLNATAPTFRAALGRAMIRNNEFRSGIKVLCKAAEAAPAEADVLSVVLDGLREAGRADLAFCYLTQARFLAPGDRGILQLWNRAKYDVAAEKQRGPKASLAPIANESVRPFLKLYREDAAPARTRRDSTSMNRAHIGRLRAFRADRG